MRACGFPPPALPCNGVCVMVSPAPTLLLRAARDDDGDAIAALIAACFAEYHGCIFARHEFPELDAPARWAAAHDAAIWVMESEAGAIIGSIAAAPAGPGEVELRKFYLAQGSRGSGLAELLLGEVAAYAAARNASCIVLWSDTRFTRAHRFYEKHGFARIGAARTVVAAETYREFRYERATAP